MPDNQDGRRQRFSLAASLDTPIYEGEAWKFSTLDSRLFSDTLQADDDRQVAKFPESCKLTLSVENSPHRMTLSVDKRLVLGRQTPETLGPLVDFTEFGAFEHGVSRQHAVLRRTSDRYLLIKDLGSKNGTFINGRRLEPLQRYLLDHGDRLQLGGLALRVSFQPVPKDAG